MEYFIVAWHNLLEDWNYSVPNIEFYDGSINMNILHHGGKQIGLIVDDYQPQLTTKLNDLDFYPEKILSVYDYLQGSLNFDNQQVLNYQDFNWPDDAIFDISSFNILVVSADKLFAKIVVDTTGKLLWIEYFDQAERLTSKVIIDSRGFVSSKETEQEIVYFDPVGHWRFIYDKQTDAVKLNPDFLVSDQLQYQHLSDLIQEILTEKILTHVTQKDHLIVTIDDQSPLSMSDYNVHHPIYVLNPKVNHTRSLQDVGNESIVVSHKDEIEQGYPNLNLIEIPSLPFQFKFGHSQRLRRQIIGVFAEGMNAEELLSLLHVLYPKLLSKPDELSLRFLTYSNDQNALINKLIKQFAEEKRNEFQLFDEKAKLTMIGENDGLKSSDKRPQLLISSHRLSSVNDAAKTLDKIRVLINWNLQDDFMMIAAVSTGIPQLQNFKSFTLHDHKNGIICQNYQELEMGLTFYLDDLQNWNESLVYNAQLLNKYSEDNLFKKWESVLSKEL
ncbi:MAG: accessory Sec system protein Asp1 [Lactobacillus sp.]|jgi:accessory secretory protein Asp1|nr:accessory Sec system protein Asp1 [Lactobacillus sp.]MCH4068795.1 accessory Sec system protein Asp1 [Lactobacillus sp.]MCI1303720.1 accessory Sec system protein Asp1 [Lactobacillus sp.]MCI1330104.1 accessory Sec system protein Asp1 [Lactobacillus sp.]MCI1359678.1 accessory Sec system protein Asp1 [Lactobacillus sp.]